MTSLIMKASMGDWNAVEQMLDEGADPDARDDQRLTALITHAVYFGHVKVVQIISSRRSLSQHG